MQGGETVFWNVDECVEERLACLVFKFKDPGRVSSVPEYHAPKRSDAVPRSSSNLICCPVGTQYIHLAKELLTASSCVLGMLVCGG